MICKWCGHEVPEGVTYCGNCGRNVKSRKPRLLPVLAAVAVIGLAVWAGAAFLGGDGDEPVVMAPTEATIAPAETEAPRTEVPTEETGVALPESETVPVVEVDPEDADITGTEAATEPDWEERLPGVPEEWKDHVLLRDRGIASCEYLRGDVVVTVVFASDPVYPWTEEELLAAQETLEQEAAILEAEAAAYGVELEISWNFLHITYGETYDQEDWYAWVKPALEENGLPHWGRFNTEMEKQFGVEAAPVVFCMNQDGRGFATGNKEADASESVMLYRDLGAFRHELCHLFGAVDYYYPQLVKEHASRLFPESLMAVSELEIVDSLTAYLIGWTDELSPEAEELLALTQEITLAEYREALRQENVTGYVIRTYDFGTYEGEQKRGIMDGWGTLTWTSGTVYTGEWYNGNVHGEGTMTWTDGTTYTGSWENGQRSGQGTMTWPDGTSYTGSWANGQRSGYGVMTWSNGTVYEGQWENDKRNGQGTLTFYNGGVYQGQFKDDEFIG